MYPLPGDEFDVSDPEDDPDNVGFWLPDSRRDSPFAFLQLSERYRPLS